MTLDFLPGPVLLSGAITGDADMQWERTPPRQPFSSENQWRNLRGSNQLWRGSKEGLGTKNQELRSIPTEDCDSFSMAVIG
jgi:hypothetical protein